MAQYKSSPRTEVASANLDIKISVCNLQFGFLLRSINGSFFWF